MFQKAVAFGAHSLSGTSIQQRTATRTICIVLELWVIYLFILQ